MIKVLESSAHLAISNRKDEFHKPLNSNIICKAPLCLFDFKLNFHASSKCFCRKNDHIHETPSQRFSVLEENTPWDNGNVWSIMGFYMFSLHIPLSFGWMSVAANILREPVLNPETEAMSLLVAQSLELISSLILLRFTAKPQYNSMDFFEVKKLSKWRNWLLVSVAGFGFLFAILTISSILVNRFFEPKAVNNTILNEILASSSLSKAVCILVYCIITPLLEEIVYRRFLLASLSSTMKWQYAVLISSGIFSAAHLSGDNFLQLFMIGCVLGCSYSWTGDLRSSIVTHSMYNALILAITLLSLS